MVPDSKARQKCPARQYSGHDALNSRADKNGTAIRIKLIRPSPIRRLTPLCRRRHEEAPVPREHRGFLVRCVLGASLVNAQRADGVVMVPVLLRESG